MYNLLAYAIVIVIGAAFCSSSEASLFSANKLKIQILADQGNDRAKKLSSIKESMGNSIGTLVLLNNIFAVGGSLFIGGAIKSLEQANHTIGIEHFVITYFEFIFTFLVILFGEIIPKNAGEKFALKWALITVPFLSAVTFVLRPILWIFEKLSSLFIGHSSNIETASEEEVIAMTDLGLESHSIEQDEHEIIQNVFKMNDRNAKDIMTPRVHMDALDCDKTLDEQREEIYAMGHSRLPVFGEDYDDIRGFVLLRDVLEELAKGNVHIKPDSVQLLHKICAVTLETKVDQLLITFQKQRIHVALVVDEYGGTAGLVTLEDVLEQLVGEIVDETDTVVDLQLEKNEHQGNIEIVGAVE
jgi:CBS domain containing-hemolysin-like protein